MLVPEWLGSLIAFIYGTAIGSFLNVCIYRIPEEQSIVTPPSHCPKCNNRLKAIDLIPLLSFLMLGRKCRYCKTPISWRYFTVELITGLLFLATYLRCHCFSIDFFVYALFVCALLIAFFVDLDRFIIPDQVVIFGLFLGLAKDVAHIIAGDAKLLYIPTASGAELPMLPSIAGAVVCAGVFYLIAYIGYFVFRPRGKSEDDSEADEYEGALGGGDINLAAAVGAVLGIMPALVSFFIAVVVGSIVGVTILVLKNRAKKGSHWRTEIPFGPHMVIGALAVILASPQIGHLWKWWVGLITPG